MRWAKEEAESEGSAMRTIHVALALVCLGAFFSLASPTAAQQMRVGTPFHTLNDSFNETMGVNWALRGNGWAASFGGNSFATAPFGGGNAANGLNFSRAFNTGDVSGMFNFTAGQGFSRSMVSQTPMMTLQNGGSGWFSDSSQSPFVAGFIPVVGDNIYSIPMAPRPPPSPSGVGSDAVRAALMAARAGQQGPPNLASEAPAAVPSAKSARQMPVIPKVRDPKVHEDLTLSGPGPAAAPAPVDRSADRLAAAQTSSAGRPAPSLELARQVQAAEQANQEQEARVFWERGQNAEEAGNLGAAKIYYQMAAKRAAGDLREQILTRLEALKGGSKGGK
jgi:hypothetical protein